MQNQNFKKPHYNKSGANHTAQPTVGAKKSANPAKKITGLFKSERGQGYEVRVTEEVAALLKDIPVGSYLKVYNNKSEKTGTEYLSLSVKTVAS
jgi:hypothetical protein